MPTSSSPSTAEVLRYWLAAMKLEAALGARPKARRRNSQVSSIDLASPSAGQNYTKLDLASHASFLLTEASTARVPLGPEGNAFFEDWLAEHRKGNDPEGGTSAQHQVLFPALLLPRNELSGILRLPVSVDWYEGERALTFGRGAGRRRVSTEAPPDVLRVVSKASEEAPYFVDLRTLREVLRMDETVLSDWLLHLRDETLSAPAVLSTLTSALEASALGTAWQPASAGTEAASETQPVVGPDAKASSRADPAQMLDRLCAAAVHQLSAVSSRAKLYPVALLLSTPRINATFHCERDLEATLDNPIALRGEGALTDYLHGGSAGLMSAPCQGRFPGTVLTERQQSVAEQIIANRSCVVQGPPGTGKTTLLRTIVSHALVTQLEPTLRGKPPSKAMHLVTSTNNRAVENALDPFTDAVGQERLPLGLRLGNREVLEVQTAAQLERCLRWLAQKVKNSASSSTVFAEDYSRALEAFRETHAQSQKVNKPALSLYEWSKTREALREQIRKLETRSEPDRLQLAIAAMASLRPSLPQQEANTATPPTGELLGATLGSAKKLQRRLERLAQLASSDPPLGTLRAHWKKSENGPLAELQAALGAGATICAPTSEDTEDWLDWAEDATAALEEVKFALEHLARDRSRRSEAAALVAKLRAHEQDRPNTPPTDAQGAGRDELREALFERSVDLREAWAVLHRAEVEKALSDAMHAAKTQRSLKHFFRSARGSGLWLKRLFPAVGCTLLSLGNSFPVDAKSFDLALVDEAGQCHPAYVVSALLRSARVALLGDTHQLEPVADIHPKDEQRLFASLNLQASSEAFEAYRVYDSSGNSAQRLAEFRSEELLCLIDHFRCQAAIANVCDTLGGYGLVCHARAHSLKDTAPALLGSVLFDDTPGVEERYGGSWSNAAEVERVLAWLQYLTQRGIKPEAIAVVTPFRGQLERLWRACRQHQLPIEPSSAAASDSSSSGIALGTVHRFQGGERDIVIFSSTTTSARRLQFIDQRPNLLNVAVSRARYHLLTVGHGPTLTTGHFARHLVTQAQPAPATLDSST